MKSNRPPILVVCPDYFPRPGGLSAHTHHLLIQLGKQGPVRLLTSSDTAQTDGLEIHNLINDWQDPRAITDTIRKIHPEGPVVWQYVPHMYGRGGVNFRLPSILGKLRSEGRRQFVIAHEIGSGFTDGIKHIPYALAHRIQWGPLVRNADAVGISTEAWLVNRVGAKPPFTGKFLLTPSPSNIPVAETAGDHSKTWRRKHDLPDDLPLMAYFGAMSWHKRFDWVIDSWKASQKEGRPVGLVMVGSVGDYTPPTELRSLFKPLGYLDEVDVSKALRAIDLLMLPYLDGVSERRGSFMAGIQHGKTVLTNLGEGTGAQLSKSDFFAASGKTDRDGFIKLANDLISDKSKLSNLGDRARRTYDERYSWDIVCRRILDRLIV